MISFRWSALGRSIDARQRFDFPKRKRTTERTDTKRNERHLEGVGTSRGLVGSSAWDGLRCAALRGWGGLLVEKKHARARSHQATAGVIDRPWKEIKLSWFETSVRAFGHYCTFWI